jgi:TPR repeat protein
VKKLLLIAAICSTLSYQAAHAADSFEVDKFNRATKFGAAAIRNKDYDNAFEHLDEASKLGDKVSQFALALLYMDGLGVEQNYAQAYLWLNVAAEVKEKRWRKVRDQLHNSLSKEQVAALKPLVSEYIKKYGAETQEISCSKRAQFNSHRKQMECSKNLTL